jgi:hypothetical protein
MLYPTELRAPAWETSHFSVCSTLRMGLMARNPFVWEIQVRREVLDDEMARLREVPYSLWKDVLKKPISKVVNARDNKPYLVRVTAELSPDGSGDIRVTMSLARARMIRRGLMRQTFTITRENTFRV